MKAFRVMLVALMVLSLGCVFASVAGAQEKGVMMATTTSTDNTGLLDYLIPHFTQKTGVELKWVAVGTGKALEYGKACDVDLLIVHAPAAEQKFIEQGYGMDRVEIMYNDFVLVGPAADPAGVANLSVREALSVLQAKKHLFVSRGDQSGTHKKELSLWKEAGLNVPENESWYLQIGQGMLAAINMAAEKQGYTLTDQGTFIKYESGFKGNAPLKIMVQGDDKLYNQYSVMLVNSERCPEMNLKGAKLFHKWVTSPKAQQLIGEFKLMGKPIFTPNAR